MVKKLVNGEVKDLTDVTIGGIRVYSCKPTDGSDFNQDDFDNSCFSQDLATEKKNVKQKTKQNSTLGNMSIFS